MDGWMFVKRQRPSLNRRGSGSVFLTATGQLQLDVIAIHTLTCGENNLLQVTSLDCQVTGYQDFPNMFDERRVERKSKQLLVS